MRSELGKIELNNIFQSRKELNLRIRETLEETTQTWGISCDRYEILKIEPPSEVMRSMQLQAEAERIKRKDIILSEARKISDINIAEGKKQVEILTAEAQAEAMEIKARKEKEGLQMIAQNVLNGKNRGIRALDYILKRKYYDEYAKILRDGKVIILPDDGNGGSDVLAAVAMMINSQGHQSPSAQQRVEPASHHMASAPKEDKPKPQKPQPREDVQKEKKKALTEMTSQDLENELAKIFGFKK